MDGIAILHGWLRGCGECNRKPLSMPQARRNGLLAKSCTLMRLKKLPPFVRSHPQKRLFRQTAPMAISVESLALLAMYNGRARIARRTFALASGNAMLEPDNGRWMPATCHKRIHLAPPISSTICVTLVSNGPAGANRTSFTMLDPGIFNALDLSPFTIIFGSNSDTALSGSSCENGTT